MTEYHNEASQAERHAIVTAKAEHAHNTYLGRAEAEIGEEMGGRFKRLAAIPVTGVPTIPTLPASSPWSVPDPTGIEPPLGVDIGAMEPTGTEQEIQRSLASLDHPAPTRAPTSAPDQPLSVEPGVGARSSFRRRV